MTESVAKELFDASSFKPLDAVQVTVLEFCRQVVMNFVDSLRFDLTEGLQYYQQALRDKTGRSQINSSPPVVVEDILHSGYTATLFFDCPVISGQYINIRLLMTAQFDAGRSRVCCILNSSEVFTLNLGFEENTTAVGERISKEYGAQVFEEINKGLGWSEGKPSLDSIGIVVRA